MLIAAPRLRANVYKVLDEVLETGKSIEIEWHGRRVRIEPIEPRGRLGSLIRRSRFLRVDPESIVHIEWLNER